MAARKRDRFFFVIGLASVLLGCNRHPLTVDDVIERNTKAMGGSRAIEEMKSIEIDLHIVDPTFEVDGAYRAMRPGKMRIDVRSKGKHVLTEAFDGQNGWEWNGKGESQPASPKGTAALRHGVQLPGKLFGLHELKKRGNRVELVGREKVDGIDYYVLRLTFGDGYTTSLYVDPASWLITRRRDVRPLHVDVDPTPTTIEQRSTDFRTVAGVRFPFATTEIDLKTGKELERTKINSVKANPPIDELTFNKL